MTFPGAASYWSQTRIQPLHQATYLYRELFSSIITTPLWILRPMSKKSRCFPKAPFKDSGMPIFGEISTAGPLMSGRISSLRLFRDSTSRAEDNSINPFQSQWPERFKSPMRGSAHQARFVPAPQQPPVIHDPQPLGERLLPSDHLLYHYEGHRRLRSSCLAQAPGRSVSSTPLSSEPQRLPRQATF